MSDLKKSLLEIADLSRQSLDITKKIHDLATSLASGAKNTTIEPIISAMIPAEPPVGGDVCDPCDMQAAIDDMKPGDTLNVRPGVLYGNLKIEGKKECVIRAIDPGTARVSGLWEAADRGEVEWKEKWGAWAADHDDSFMGSCDDNFMFRYKSVDDLKADKIGRVRKPDYGYAFRGQIFVSLPNKESPNGKSIKLCDMPKQKIIKVKNSPELRLDGFAIEGSGGTDAIMYDGQSVRPIIANCVFEYCRRAARLPHQSLVEWTEYKYPGFKKFYDDLFDLNDRDGTVIFDLVKKYWATNGNAAIEGGLAESIYDTGSEACEFRYNFYHQTFDGERLGCFKGKENKDKSTKWTKSHHNVYKHNYDNHFEAESWKASRPTSHLHLHHSRFEECIAGPASHQDSTGKGMKGPHKLTHSIIRSVDTERYHPPFLIKLLNLDSIEDPIIYERNYLEQAPGYNEGFGKANTIMFALRKQAIDNDKIKLRDNVIYDVGLTKAKGEPDYSKNNLMVKEKLSDAALTELIGEEVNDDWPRPSRRAFSR